MGERQVSRKYLSVSDSGILKPQIASCGGHQTKQPAHSHSVLRRIIPIFPPALIDQLKINIILKIFSLSVGKKKKEEKKMASTVMTTLPQFNGLRASSSTAPPVQSLVSSSLCSFIIFMHVSVFFFLRH